MEAGYIDETGTYDEHCRPETFKEKKARQKRSKNWFDSLSESEREIIKWCRGNQKAISEGLGIAQCRERKLDEFYRKMTNTNPPKKEQKYAYVWTNMDEFKLFINLL